tara:strand:- start:1438 stop:2811 length:1374 start_codon:yes stop_codon:yes gene_type:complete
MGSVVSTQESNFAPHLEVEGSRPLSGYIQVSGAKNSALALMAASLLTEKTVEIKNIPSLTDIDVMRRILLELGIKIKREKNTLLIDPEKLRHIELPQRLVHRLRASFFCIGPLLARLGRAKVPLPGGCQIGLRPVDEHIQGLKALGAKVDLEKDMIIASLTGNKKRLTAAKIVLNCPSVGATETILMAAVLAEGTTKIYNSAKEPEIQDLANMLNSMGARIAGAGTSEITINGVQKLNGCVHSAIPDRIEAGTYLIAAAITRSPLLIGPVISSHLNALLRKLRDCGCDIKEEGNSIRIIPGEIKGVDIKTDPFPGFPTDLQAPFMALMTTAKGKSEINETIFENRMQHVGELQKMGASIKLKGSKALIKGVAELKGNDLTAGDLRASAAIILASLSAKGTSKIKGLHHLDRGYENFEEKLSKVGCNIYRRNELLIHKNISSCELATQNNLPIKQAAA